MSGAAGPLPSRLALFTDRRFLLLWAAMLVSATGSFMLLLAVSAELLKRHGSGLGAASVFAFQWILPVVAVSLVRRLADRRLWLAAGYVVAATGVLQGFHNTARVVLPMRHLGLDESAVMHLQITSGLAIILGAVAIPVLGALARHRSFAPLTHLGACVMLWAVTLVAGETGLHLGYFAYIFLFEAAFTAAQAQLIQATPSRDMATMQAAVGALGTSLLIGCTLLSGALADLMPLPVVAAITAGIGVVILLAIEAGSRHGIRKAAGI